MFDAAKSRAKALALRASLALNAAALALLFIAYLGIHTGHMQADVQLTGWEVGGGTSEHAERDQQLAALASAMPITAITPAPKTQNASTVPLPGRKPKAPQ